jgi:putative SOS response-associated peptidase YedK
MCGRYILAQAAAAERYFQVHGTPWSPSFNVAPTQQVPVVRIKSGSRVGETLRWGLIPFFAKGEPPKYSAINARIETVETAASYRGPWKRGQRCLQVASGFYEWHLGADGKKFPYYIHLNDQEHFAFAALWDSSTKQDGSVIESVVHITMPANELMADIHNTGNNPHRMPAILRAEDHEAWLTGSVDEARAVLRQYATDLMVAYRVSTKVNTPKNNSPDLIEPAREAPAEASLEIESEQEPEKALDEDPQRKLL